VGADRILMLKLLGDTSSIDKSLRKTEGRLKNMSRAGLQWGKAFALNLAIDGVEKLGDAIGDAWTGFREGEKAGAQLATTWANLGKDGDELAGVIDAISRSTLKLGTDDTEAINAYNTALKTVGGDGKKAMQRLRIAQDLVANGSAPNLSSALQIIQGAAKGSARTVDKFGLTSKTAAGRVKELGEKVKGAGAAAAKADPLRVLLNEMNEALEGIVGSISKGDLEGAMTSLQGIGTALATTWAKVGPAVTGVLDKLSGGAFSEFMKKLDETFRPALEKFVAVIDDMAYAWQNIQPILAQVLTFIQPVIDLLSTTAEGGLGFVLDAVGGVLRTVGTLLTGDFSAAWESAGDTIARLAADVQTIINGMLEFLRPVVDTIGEIARNIGNSIYGGIRGGLNAVVGLVRYVINKVIGALNSINDFSWSRQGFEVNTLFGNAFVGVDAGSIRLWPEIPQMAKGGIVSSPTLAMIGEAGPEAVVPLGRGGGMGGNITININVPPTADMASIGREVTRALKAYGQGGGIPSMKSAIGIG
jgi:hypothetical protein